MSKPNKDLKIVPYGQPPQVKLYSNIASFLIYALSLATALGFNDLVLTIFDSFSKTKSHIIGKTIYVVLMFIITIAIAHYMGTNIQT